MMKTILIIAMLLFPIAGVSQDMGSYLIQNDIGGYRFRPKPTKRIYGNSGVLISAGHFYIDHDDLTYETEYILPSPLLGVEVQVTQHSGDDSDKWLLHEVENNFRLNPEQDRFKGVIREINGNRIFTYVRGTHYNWISNNIVVDIRYTDLQKVKPEPTEVITAYLQKHPSTIPALVMDAAHDIQWIKTEMDRRLWLCDKWFMQLQLKKAEEKDVYREAVTSMNVFLDYREKYYGMDARSDKILLAGYLDANNATGIKSKLTEYKNWWGMNKAKAISL
jgi:hypothetical protein